MQDNDLLLFQDLYTKHLTLIQNIHFTQREIDVMACLLHARGTSKIASLLAVAPSTIVTHIQNVMAKLHCNSREGIVDFIEKSPQLPFMRKYYAYLTGHVNEEGNAAQASSFDKRYWYFVLAVFLIGFISIGFCYFQILRKNLPSQGSSSLRSELIVPAESAFLPRSELIRQIADKFKNPQDIQTVALVGMGGAGKTTLARQYARAHQAGVVWQINAETPETLKASFESLAAALAQTEEDKKKFRSLQDINASKEKEAAILLFVKEKMRGQSHWLLIYDNVEKFTDIQPYFPHDATIWGNGKILLTTRDLNIQNNAHVHHVISIGELTPSQKLTLFLKIMTNGTPPSFMMSHHKEEKAFLTQIPSFPLDVSTAAYYLKATHVSYDKYLSYLAKGESDFENVQKNLLKEAGDYTKTRYQIITRSLKQLMETHKVFGELLLLVCLLDSQHIPRDLLSAYKGDVIVDNFIYHLKRYGLVTDEGVPSSAFGKTISLHRSTQAIGLAYLTKALDLEHNDSLLKTLAHILKNYSTDAIDKEDVPRIRLLIHHCESFLQHAPFLADPARKALRGELGGLYFCTGHHSKAKKILESSLIYFNNNAKDSAHILIYLSQIYKKLTAHEKAKALLNKSLLFYQKQTPPNQGKLAQILADLGRLEGELGHYEKSRDLLEKSLLIYTQHYPDTPLKKAEILTSLGNLYRELGDYERAKEALEQSLNIYKNDAPASPIKIAHALTRLGNVYRSLGQYHKAQEALEQSCVLYKKSYPENHISVAWVSAHLGNIYKKLGNYEKAKSLLEKSDSIYKTYFHENHLANAWVLIHLGNTYKALGDKTKAKEALEKGYGIFKTHNLGIVWASSHLGNMYREQGDFKRAKELLEYSLQAYEKHTSKNDVRRALVLRYLGTLYRDLKHYKKAKTLFEASRTIYEKVQHKDSLENALILQDLAKVYLLEGSTETAENLLFEALNTFHHKAHPDVYSVLEDLADLELQKAKKAENSQQMDTYKTQAIYYLNQALEIIKTRFPKASPHEARIQAKLKKLE